MKDMNEAMVYLGLVILWDRSKGKLYLSQHKYSIKLLFRFWFLDCKTESTPMNESGNLKKLLEMSCVLGPTTKFPYREANGSLVYLMFGTRPDFTFAVRMLAKFCNFPTIVHWHEEKHLFRYIGGTLWRRILNQRSRKIDLSGYCDADWGGGVKTRKSTSGYLFKISGGVLSWGSKNQSCHTLSICEAEYVASCMPCEEGIWVVRFFVELELIDKKVATSIFNDSAGASKLLNNEDMNQGKNTSIINTIFSGTAYKQKLFSLQYTISKLICAIMLPKPLLKYYILNSVQWQE